MELSVRYGDGHVSLRIPSTALAWRHGLASHDSAAGVPGGHSPWDVALAELADAGFGEALAGRRLGLLLADGTRAWRPAELLGPLAPRLEGAAEVTALLCTGTHAAGSPESRADDTGTTPPCVEKRVVS